MHGLTFLIALLSAAMLAPGVLRMLAENGHTRANYRARTLPFPFGVLVLVAALLALIPLMLLQVLGLGRTVSRGGRADSRLCARRARAGPGR